MIIKNAAATAASTANREPQKARLQASRSKKYYFYKLAMKLQAQHELSLSSLTLVMVQLMVCNSGYQLIMNRLLCRHLSHMSQTYLTEEQVAITAVRRACHLTSSVFNTLVKNETLTKGDKSPVTGARSINLDSEKIVTSFSFSLSWRFCCASRHQFNTASCFP